MNIEYIVIVSLCYFCERLCDNLSFLSMGFPFSSILLLLISCFVDSSACAPPLWSKDLNPIKSYSPSSPIRRTHSLGRRALSNSSSSYTFDASSDHNVAVYYGRTDLTDSTTLFAQCNDTNIDMVILAFVTDIFGGGGYPDISFGDLCSGQTSQMQSAGATGLQSCDTLAPMINQCQNLGKKVIVAIGGANGNVTFNTTANANNGAKLLWDVFGGGNGVDSGLRPFGSVTVDGFDIGMLILLHSLLYVQTC